MYVSAIHYVSVLEMNFDAALASENFNAQKCEVVMFDTVWGGVLYVLQSVKWMDMCCLALMDVDEKASVIARVEEDVGWKRLWDDDR